MAWQDSAGTEARPHYCGSPTLQRPALLENSILAERCALRHIGLLFWLKWKLMLRGYRRNTSALVGALLMLLFFAPFSIGIAFLAGLGFMQLSPDYALQ